MFTRPDSCLVFHLTNHYTVVFAIRVWTIENPSNATQPIEIVRQICCARKGQRPTAWINFNECRDIMLNWEGYKMMVVQFNPDWSHIDLNNFKTHFIEKLDEVTNKNNDLNTVMSLIKCYHFSSR